jgi:signal peptidase II
MIKSNTFNIKNIAIISTLAIFFLLDRYLKYLAVNNNPNLNLLGDYLKFTLSKNFNIAFSLPVSGPILNIIILSIILCLVFYLIYLIKRKYSYVVIMTVLALILGAFSNALDRLIYGYVIDYLDILNFTILNIADIIISISSLFLIYLNTKLYDSRKK